MANTVIAKDAILGSTYLSVRGVLPDGKQESVRIWKKDKVVYAFMESIKRLVRLPLDYVLEIDSAFPPHEDVGEYIRFDVRVSTIFMNEFPGQPIPGTKKRKEDSKMSTQVNAETTATNGTAVETGKTKKQLRAEYHTTIQNLKDEREALSKRNAELKKQVQSTEDKSARKPLNAEIKENVDKRAKMSDEIKAVVTLIKNLRA